MEGIEEEVEGVEGVSHVVEGVRADVGVENISWWRPREAGVWGNKIEFLVGLLVGLLALLEGVIGKGTANSRGLVGDLEGDFAKGLGEVGVARMEADEGDLGEEEASRRVRVEGCLGVGRGGNWTIGISGMVSAK